MNLTPTEVTGLQREIDFYAVARHRHNMADIKKFLKAVRAKFKDEEIAELWQGFKVKHKNGSLHVYSFSTGNWYSHEG